MAARDPGSDESGGTAGSYLAGESEIDKQAFLKRCFPTAQRLTSQEFLHITDLPGDDVFVRYEYELKTGDRHRNTEVITVHDG